MWKLVSHAIFEGFSNQRCKFAFCKKEFKWLLSGKGNSILQQGREEWSASRPEAHDKKKFRSCNQMLFRLLENFPIIIVNYSLPCGGKIVKIFVKRDERCAFWCPWHLCQTFLMIPWSSSFKDEWRILKKLCTPWHGEKKLTSLQLCWALNTTLQLRQHFWRRLRNRPLKTRNLPTLEGLLAFEVTKKCSSRIR